MTSSYPYMSPNDPSKDKKNYRDADGRVISKAPNMLISPQSKISYNRNKEFKYTECPPPKRPERVPEEEDNAQEPFKTGSPHKDIFNSNYQTYFDAELKKGEAKKSLLKVASHEGPFKLSCISKGTAFTPLVYTEEGNGKPKVLKAEKKENKGEPFR
jgi:hypothetical protein